MSGAKEWQSKKKRIISERNVCTRKNYSSKDFFPSLHNCKCFIHSVCMSVAAFLFGSSVLTSDDPKVYFLFVANILYEYLVSFHSLCFRCLSSLITFFAHISRANEDYIIHFARFAFFSALPLLLSKFGLSLHFDCSRCQNEKSNLCWHSFRRILF